MSTADGNNRCGKKRALDQTNDKSQTNRKKSCRRRSVKEMKHKQPDKLWPQHLASAAARQPIADTMEAMSVPRSLSNIIWEYSSRQHVEIVFGPLILRMLQKLFVTWSWNSRPEHIAIVFRAKRLGFQFVDVACCRLVDVQLPSHLLSHYYCVEPKQLVLSRRFFELCGKALKAISARNSKQMEWALDDKTNELLVYIYDNHSPECNVFFQETGDAPNPSKLFFQSKVLSGACCDSHSVKLKVSKKFLRNLIDLAQNNELKLQVGPHNRVVFSSPNDFEFSLPMITCPPLENDSACLQYDLRLLQKAMMDLPNINSCPDRKYTVAVDPTVGLLFLRHKLGGCIVLQAVVPVGEYDV